MIILREYRDDDFKEVRYILDQEKIEDLNLEGIINVVLDNEKLIGVGKVKLEDDKYFLKYLIIKEEERNKGFGDALIRAILYKLENRNVNKLYFNGNDDYLFKKGFKREIKETLSIDIKTFFNDPCNCSGECYGI